MPALTATRVTGDPPAALSFVRYDMSKAGSASSLFVKTGPRCGIYVLEFEDGWEYVGKTVDIVSRYAAHRRKHGDIVALRFAVCGKTDLDRLERLIVAREEGLGIQLRNLDLTGMPGGLADMNVSSTDGASIVLPWNRSERIQVANEPPSSKEARFWELSRHAQYPELLQTLGAYVNETIPDPVDSQGIWSLTALPNTGRTKESRRLATLSIGSLEVVYVVERPADASPTVFPRVNVWDDGSLTQESASLRHRTRSNFELQQANYGVAHPIMTLMPGGQGDLMKLLKDPLVLDAAYRLNVTLMRQGSRMFSRYHNASFAVDVLRAARSMNIK